MNLNWVIGPLAHCYVQLQNCGKIYYGLVEPRLKGLTLWYEKNKLSPRYSLQQNNPFKSNESLKPASI